MLGSVFYWPFAAAMTTQMKRIESRYHPLSSIQLAAATGVVIGLLIPMVLWFTVAFRPDVTSPANMLLVNDLAWIVFVALYPPAFLQCVVIGVCIVSDNRAEKIYPRWLGYVNLWAAVGFTPGAVVPFFRRGPFAWNGLIGFWIPAIVFFAWVILMWWTTVRAINLMDTVPGGDAYET